MAKVPCGHQVCERVVVDVFVVLVRPNHMANVVEAIGFKLATTRPESGAFHKDLCTIIQQELVVPRALPISPDRISNICRDVDFQFTVPYPNEFTAWRDRRLGRYLLPGIGRFPCIHRPLVSGCASFVSCCRKRVVPVSEECSRRIWRGTDIEREHVDLGVPEHMTTVGTSGECAGSNRAPVIIRVSSADQVIHRKTKCSL